MHSSCDVILDVEAVVDVFVDVNVGDDRCIGLNASVG
jgi:hypothetical protein